MKRIDLFSDLNTVNAAIEVVAARFGIVVHHRGFASLSNATDKTTWNMPQSNAVIGISNHRDFNVLKASACLTRLRCPPFNYCGPMAIVAALGEREVPLPEWLGHGGIALLKFPSLVVPMLQIVSGAQQWPALPHLGCRPAWALLGEANAYSHEINNLFNSIAEDMTENEQQFAERIRVLLSQESLKGDK
jgi:hypothetical protein